MNDIKVERTGNVFSSASSEFRVTYPDGYVGTLWSPPWHEMTPEQEELEAKVVALKSFSAGMHKMAATLDSEAL